MPNCCKMTQNNETRNEKEKTAYRRKKFAGKEQNLVLNSRLRPLENGRSNI